eukprot:Seg2525.1 transcript_id=Seg2525.1/GoldUCD/mRNA.D3Y31 product="Formin-binding protein 4" protein_id=Seg2525.1/GoldUCD/D3Y31
MGKRSKEKRLAGFAGRRKQTLQLDGIGRTTTPSYDIEEQYGSPLPLRATKVSGIGLLGAYQEDSDEDSGTESPIVGGQNQNLTMPTGKQRAGKIDDQLAGFLAEINAIDDGPSSATNSTGQGRADVYDPLNFDPFTQGHLLPPAWQAVLDESSGYHYYWNSETNEVQWEPPPAPSMQGPQMPEPPPPPPPPASVISDNADVRMEEAEVEGPNLAEIEAKEEEERRKAMSAKLSGLSKKERIKLLLQKNKMNIDEPATENASKNEKNDSNAAASSVEKIDSAADGKTNVKDSKLSSLVIAYDSDVSDDEDGAETAHEAKKEVELSGIVGQNKLYEMVVSVDMKKGLTSDALAEMESLFEEANKLPGFEKTKEEIPDKKEICNNREKVDSEMGDLKALFEEANKLRGFEKAKEDIADTKDIGNDGEKVDSEMGDSKEDSSKVMKDELSCVQPATSKVVEDKKTDTDKGREEMEKVVEYDDDSLVETSRYELEENTEESEKDDKERPSLKTAREDTLEEEMETEEKVKIEESAVCVSVEPTGAKSSTEKTTDESSVETKSRKEMISEDLEDVVAEKESMQDDVKIKGSKFEDKEPSEEAVNLETQKQKEFSVDMFAEESDHEGEELKKECKDLETDGKKDVSKGISNEDESDKECKLQEKKVCKDIKEGKGQSSKSGEKSKSRASSKDSAKDGSKGSSKGSSKEKFAKGKLSKDSSSKVKDKGTDEGKKSKHKEKKKDKEKSKDKKKDRKHKNEHKNEDKKHKDSDKKHKDSDKKRKEDKDERSSRKKHSEKDRSSEKNSRKSKEEIKMRKKEEEILTEKDKLRREEERRKAIQEEIKREERLRSEYEKSQKEERERREEVQRKKEIEDKKLEEKKKEEEMKKEEEIDDFAAMLLEGALEGDVGSPVEPKSEAVADMEISDNEEATKPPLPPMPHPDDEPALKQSNWEIGNNDDAYHEEMQTKISDLSIELLDKLEFLEVSKKGLTNFQVMFIEMETRMSDWREGALDSEYLLYKLEQVDAEIRKYEETAAPEGWSCHWSSEHGMYYYYNEQSGESTWSYPVLKTKETPTTYTAQTVAYGPMPQPEAATPVEVTDATTPVEPTAAPLENYGYGRSNLMMWRSDLVQNERKVEEKAAAENNEKKSGDPYRDPYRRIVAETDDSKPASPADETPLPPGEDEEVVRSPWDDGTRSGTTSPLPTAMIASAPAKVVQPATASTLPISKLTKQEPATASTLPISKLTKQEPATTATFPISKLTKQEPAKTSTLPLPKLTKQENETTSSTIIKAATVISAVPRVSSESVLSAAATPQVQAAIPLSQSTASLTQIKPEKKKKEKRKKLTSSGLPSKKLKTVSSLVQKWQQVKQKVDEEMMEDLSEDEDPEVLSQKRIVEWKRAQLDSGRAAYNSNFEEIKGDWREKIKKKKQ